MGVLFCSYFLTSFINRIGKIVMVIKKVRAIETAVNIPNDLAIGKKERPIMTKPRVVVEAARKFPSAV